jgi:hypothetical protein
MTSAPTSEVVARAASAGLGEPIRVLESLGRPRPGRFVCAAQGEGFGALVVKLRQGDRAGEKTEWRTAHLPLLASRGFPVPTILWHGPVGDGWHAVVEERLSGAPLASLSKEQLAALLDLLELQADAGIEPGPRDFAAYISNVLFEGWDDVWRDAASASPAAADLCARLRDWLRPHWGHRLHGGDFAHNDLNLSNVLSDGVAITGIVDWDEFGLNSRATDLIALAFDCRRREQDGISVPTGATRTLLEQAQATTGDAGVRCLVSYRIIAHLAALARRGEIAQTDRSILAAQRMIDLAG